MFGELALSEKAFADHGILTLGSATADANFTLGKPPHTSAWMLPK